MSPSGRPEELPGRSRLEVRVDAQQRAHLVAFAIRQGLYYDGQPALAKAMRLLIDREAEARAEAEAEAERLHQWLVSWSRHQEDRLRDELGECLEGDA